jgi:hypothetical protein
MEMKLYRFPKLRPPVINRRYIPPFIRIVTQIVERFRPVQLTAYCFLDELHPIPRLKYKHIGRSIDVE